MKENKDIEQNKDIERADAGHNAADPGNFDRKALIALALEAQKNAYAPYSGYYVGAAALFDSGKVYTGANVENASYPAGMCAERTAIFSAVARGERRLIAVAVAGGAGGNNSGDYGYPCGICRQVMREFGSPKEITVLIARTVDDYIERTLDELLPLSFGPENMR